MSFHQRSSRGPNRLRKTANYSRGSSDIPTYVSGSGRHILLTGGSRCAGSNFCMQHRIETIFISKINRFDETHNFNVETFSIWSHIHWVTGHSLIWCRHMDLWTCHNFYISSVLDHLHIHLDLLKEGHLMVTFNSKFELILTQLQATLYNHATFERQQSWVASCQPKASRPPLWQNGHPRGKT